MAMLKVDIWEVNGNEIISTDNEQQTTDIITYIAPYILQLANVSPLN